jgi:phosphonatase-like hydrolase
MRGRDENLRLLAESEITVPAGLGGDRVSDAPPVTMVCADLFGSAVADGGMVERAFAEAIGTQGIVTGTAAYARCMVQAHQGLGEADLGIFRRMFPGNEAQAQVTKLAFERSFGAAIDRTGLSAVSGAEAAIEKLTAEGVRVCLISGTSRGLLGRILDTLGWWDRVDLVLCPDDVERGCPWPDLVLSAVLRLGIADVREVAVVGGTESAILCGRRAGARIVAGVASGPHSSQKLRRAGATHMIASIADLPDLVTPVASAGTSGGPHGTQPMPAMPQVPLEGRRAGL